MPLYPPATALALQAATPVAGYTLVNSTGTVISWTTPNDGKLHRFMLFASGDVTSTETGGQILCSYTLPDSTSASHTVLAAGLGSGDQLSANAFLACVQAGTAVRVFQNTALTGGAAVLWAEIWGS